MRNFLYMIVMWIADIHNRILALNDNREVPFTDKQLHFIVIGIIGMIMIFIVYPLFKSLAEHNHTMVIAWIYVFTLIIVLTFAIEIGQGYTGTGAMEFEDIMFGIVGFLAMFAVFAFLRWVYHGIVRWNRSRKRRRARS